MISHLESMNTEHGVSLSEHGVRLSEFVLDRREKGREGGGQKPPSFNWYFSTYYDIVLYVGLYMQDYTLQIGGSLL